MEGEIDKMDFSFDDNNPASIEKYAKQLVGKTFMDVIEMQTRDDESRNRILQAYGNKARKGGLGNLLEEVYFGYKANSISEADFSEAGVELKATPYEKKKNGELKAGERLVLGMISYDKPIELDLYSSHMWGKSRLILLIYYYRNRQLLNNLMYSIDYVKLFTPSEADLLIIEQDYKIIAEKIRAGKAHELSEGDTMYLGACTKGATAEKSLTSQYYNPDIPAKKRAFCYKISYMTYVLNEYMSKEKYQYESIIKDILTIKDRTLKEYCIEKVDYYVKQEDKDLCSAFEVEYQPQNKRLWFDLAMRLLGVKSNKAQEFVKANIVVKSIRVLSNGKIREQSPLPTVTFKELVKEEWEESSVYEYLSQTSFFFVIWRESDMGYRLEGAKFWHIPETILDTVVKEEWEKIVAVIKNGVVFHHKKTASGEVIENNIPGIKDTKVIHMRPHTSKAAYKLKDGTLKGDYEKDGDELPNGEYMTRQSFWLNTDFIAEQLNLK